MDSITINNYTTDVIVAVTDEEQSKGLMGYKWPPPPMIFPYSSSKIRKFWMKNTPSPLDIIFCNDGVIVDIFYGVPNSYDLMGPETPCNLVLELPLGTAASKGIKRGDAVYVDLGEDTAYKLRRHSEIYGAWR